jgi:glycosyltransferase involved in cell wall biosynthesis
MKLAIVSTYPPRPCGIGVFTSDLRAAIAESDPAADVNIVSVVSDAVSSEHRGTRKRTLVRSAVRKHPPEVVASLRQHVRADYATVARALVANGTDAVLIEHEFGIFGGDAGEYILTMLEELTVPVVVTLHTVLSSPSRQQASVLRAICERATLVTVFTETARRMVVAAGIVADARVRVVPHGAPALVMAGQLAATADAGRAASNVTTALTTRDPSLGRLEGRTVLSTFGLISSGKGIEFAIRALPEVVRRHPDVLYLVAGQTHPEVVRNEGESYRHRLESLVHELDLAEHVQFLNRFLTIDELAVLLSSTDLYLTPYRSREQIVSGALTFALAAGCPVVSTPYFYAEDLLSTGAGVLVPFGDATAMAQAVLDLLDSPAKLARARAEANRVAAQLSWPSVGRATLQVVADAASIPAAEDRTSDAPLPSTAARQPEYRLDHLLTMVDDVGIIQHAHGVVPRRSTGYCVDDTARLIRVALRLRHRLAEHDATRLLRGGLAFLEHAWDSEASGMHNFLAYDRRWDDAPGVGDHLGRAVWALGEVVAARPEAGEGQTSRRLLEWTEPCLRQLTSPRTMAFAILGLARPEPEQLSDDLADLLGALANRLLELYERGATGGFRFVGNRWRDRRALRPATEEGDEQPLEAAALVEALVEAYAASDDTSYGRLAVEAFAWFNGANQLGVAVYDAASGGCRDGLGPSGLNENEGAESTLAYWQARLALEHAGLISRG